MDDWEFLYDMKNEGYSDEDILEAQASGASPEQWAHIAKQERNAEWENLKSLMDSSNIKRRVQKA